MKLPVLSSKNSLKGKRVLLRVDWNVPLGEQITGEDSLKIDRSLPNIVNLAERGAIVIILTHLGRPNGRDLKFSTRELAESIEKRLKMKVRFVPSQLDEKKGLEEAREMIAKAYPGSIILLENVRFLKGEEKNTPALAKSLASLGDVFVNDAFASCHRAHASVVGVTKYLPSFAGPALLMEVEGLSRLIAKPKRPFIALVAGAKLSTKMNVISSLLKVADKVMIGGAMAHAFLAAKGLQIGKSYLEKEGVALAKKMLKNPKLMLPVDAVVAGKIDTGVKARVVLVTEIKKTDAIGDIGTETMRTWANEFKKAKTIVWNGPVGVTEIATFSHGSLVMARAIASRSKGLCYGAVGGGDTLPVVFASGVDEWFDHLSTGGGAMLEFIANSGKLQGLTALMKK